MPIRYTTTVEVKIPQLVHCIQCDCKFIYEMAVTGIGCDDTGLFQSGAEARASATGKAQASLNRRLSKPMLCEAIPCPKCYRYQPYMHIVAARERFTDYRFLVLPLGLLCAAVASVATICWFQYPDTQPIAMPAGLATLAVWFVGGVTLDLLRKRIERYDPNTQELSQREALAEKRTVSPTDFDATQAKRVRREYKEYFAAMKNPRWGGSSFEVPQPLVVEWWFTSSIMLNGGSIVIDLPGGESATFHVPEDTLPGEVLDVHASSQSVLPFQLRVLAIRSHPDEQRLE